MIEFLSEHAGTIAWTLGGLYILSLEVLALYDNRVNTLSSYFWKLIGHTDETRWVFSPVKILVLMGWLILSSHLFIGIP